VILLAAAGAEPDVLARPGRASTRAASSIAAMITAEITAGEANAWRASCHRLSIITTPAYEMHR
jgi:hypothetical protein